MIYEIHRRGLKFGACQVSKVQNGKLKRCNTWDISKDKNFTSVVQIHTHTTIIHDDEKYEAGPFED